VEQEDFEDASERSKLFDVCWNFVEQENFEDASERSKLFDVCWNAVEQEDFEDASERSKLFDVCWNAVEQEDFEDASDRSNLFDVCWNLVEQEDFEDTSDRSKLFDVCWNLVEQEDWEGSSDERSGRFKMASAELESDSDNDAAADTLLLPPHWSRAELRLNSGGAPLKTIVIDINPQEGVFDASQVVSDGKFHTHFSPNNVASMFDSFPLPALELAH